MRNIPALRLSYGHVLLQHLARRGQATLGELLDVPDVEDLFKSDREHKNPEGRAEDLLRYAAIVGLVTDERGRWTLTEAGRAYADAADRADPWTVTSEQARVLRAFLVRPDDDFAADARLVLDLY